MKGHVGDGAWSGDFKAPDTSNQADCHILPVLHALDVMMHVHSYPLRLTVQVSAP
jgi:hypothetical protein